MAPTAEQKGSQREVMAIAPWWCLHLWRGSLSLHRPGKPQSLISIIQSIWACISNGESPNQWVIGLLSLLPVLGRSPYFSTLHTFSTHTHTHSRGQRVRVLSISREVASPLFRPEPFGCHAPSSYCGAKTSFQDV